MKNTWNRYKRCDSAACLMRNCRKMWKAHAPPKIPTATAIECTTRTTATLLRNTSCSAVAQVGHQTWASDVYWSPLCGVLCRVVQVVRVLICGMLLCMLCVRVHRMLRMIARCMLRGVLVRMIVVSTVGFSSLTKKHHGMSKNKKTLQWVFNAGQCGSSGPTSDQPVTNLFCNCCNLLHVFSDQHYAFRFPNLVFPQEEHTIGQHPKTGCSKVQNMAGSPTAARLDHRGNTECHVGELATSCQGTRIASSWSP
jgi:hypothetical protein